MRRHLRHFPAFEGVGRLEVRIELVEAGNLA